jgi:hypothetical protein
MDNFFSQSRTKKQKDIDIRSGLDLNYCDLNDWNGDGQGRGGKRCAGSGLGDTPRNARHGPFVVCARAARKFRGTCFLTPQRVHISSPQPWLECGVWNISFRKSGEGKIKPAQGTPNESR